MYTGLQASDIRIHHFSDQLLERCLCGPTQFLKGLSWVALQHINLGRAQEARVDYNVLLRGQSNVCEGEIAELLN